MKRPVGFIAESGMVERPVRLRVFDWHGEVRHNNGFRVSNLERYRAGIWNFRDESAARQFAKRKGIEIVEVSR